MRVAITGAGGFLGALLARTLLAADEVRAGGRSGAIEELVLLDLVEPPPDLTGDRRVRTLVGPLADRVADLDGVDLLFHLAGVVSGAAEADLDLGLETNVDGMRAVLDRCRGFAEPPVVVFSSSVAVFGEDPAAPGPPVIADDTLPRPQTSYGIQKFIGEQLLADYSRRGLVDGRSVRLMTVTVRPGRANAAASSFLSGIVREPLAGLPADCPVPPDTPVAVSSPARTIEGLLRAAAVPADEWGSRTALTLPALTTTPRAMVEALERIAGQEVAARVRWTSDPEITRMFAGWPAVLRTDRAAALGLRPEPDFESIVRAYLADQAERAPS